MTVHKATPDKLFDFVYSGTDRLGQPAKGELTSKSMVLARAQLRQQGITVDKIRRKPKPLFGLNQKIKALDLAIFVRQLATMVKAGVPLIQSFEIVAESLQKPSMQALVLSLKTEVASGTPLAAAFRQHPQYFDTLFCALVDAGERSGSLETMLERIAVYKEKNEALKLKIKKAIKYPLAVICVAIVVALILLIKVVPIFEDFFASLGSELPLFTQWVILLSEQIRQGWYVLVLGGFFISISVIQARKRNQKFRYFLANLLLKLPIIGNITHQAIIARFARTLSTTFAAGVPLIDALDATAAATNHPLYYDATQHIKTQVAAGQQLNFAMRNSQLFPNLVIQMVSIGEEAGSLDDMLDKVATHYENQVDHNVDGLTSLMEPAIMVILGILIGGLVVALYLPIFQMGSVIG